MNSKIIKINDSDRDIKWFVCRVVRVFKDKGFGFAVYRGDEVMFHGRQMMAVEAGRDCPEFRTLTTEAVAPSFGDKIIVMVSDPDQNGRYHATAWAPFKSYADVKSAMDDSRLRWAPQTPKPAPAVLKPASAPFSAGPAFVPSKPKQSAVADVPVKASIIPFESSGPSSEGLSFLSEAVEAARVQARAQG